MENTKIVDALTLGLIMGLIIQMIIGILMAVHASSMKAELERLRIEHETTE